MGGGGSSGDRDRLVLELMGRERKALNKASAERVIQPAHAVLMRLSKGPVYYASRLDTFTAATEIRPDLEYDPLIFRPPDSLTTDSPS